MICVKNHSWTVKGRREGLPRGPRLGRRRAAESAILIVEEKKGPPPNELPSNNASSNGLRLVEI